MFGFKRGQPRIAGTAAHSSPRVSWDIHAHIIPGVDDGVRTVAEAVETITALRAIGYVGSIVTPHIYRGVYANTRQSLLTAAASFREELRTLHIDYGIELAAEYFADEHLIELVEREELLSFGRERRYVLIEFPYSVEPLLWADALTALLRKQYTPVVAHIERYHFVCEQPALWLERFRKFNVAIQCNIGSLVGQYGKYAFELARQMRDQRIATFWGTDVHRPSQVAKFVRTGLTHLTELGELNTDLQAVVAHRTETS